MQTFDAMTRARWAREFDELKPADLPPAATFVFARESSEDRGRHSVWDTVLATRANECVEVLPTSGTGASRYLMSGRSRTRDFQCHLRDDEAIRTAIGASDHLVLDVSGFAHNVWASILRAALGVVKQIDLIYVEPDTYRSHPSPASLGAFSLSSAFEGIRPIPGYARLASRGDNRQKVFVPQLGFEGARPRMVHAEIDPARVTPIVALPGFQFDFPAIAIACNQSYLDEMQLYRHLRYVRGSCPFAVYEEISRILVDVGAEVAQIAPIGTKPHAIGAFLFALLRPDEAELIYDHPVRRPSRTIGVATVHMYDITAFVSSKWRKT